MQHAISILKVARDNATQNRSIALQEQHMVEAHRLDAVIHELDDAIDNLEYEWHFRQCEIHKNHLARLDIAIEIHRADSLNQA